MISIVVCSRNLEDAKKLSSNVDSTIGVPYEMIIIDNSHNKYGICEAYNLGARQSKYDILCFVHEDLKLHTDNWGSHIVKTLADVSIGLLGVAGSTYVLDSPSAWWHGGDKNQFINIMHTTDTKKQVVENKNYCNNYQLTDVAVIDGVWMCTRKEVWQQKPFDADILDEFHFYDMDFSLGVRGSGLRVCVTFGVMIEHFSMGSINNSWTKNALKFYSKHHTQLPYGVDNNSGKESEENKVKINKYFINRLLEGNYGIGIIIVYLWKGFKMRPFDKDLIYLLKKMIKRKKFSDFKNKK